MLQKNGTEKKDTGPKKWREILFAEALLARETKNKNSAARIESNKMDQIYRIEKLFDVSVKHRITKIG